MSTTLTWAGFNEYLNTLGGMLVGMTFEKPLKTISFYFASKARENFDQGKSPDGVPWADLIRPSKRRGGKSAKPLRDTGKLMASLVGRATGNVEKIGPTSIEWGSNIEYGPFHQWGTRRMVARPFLGLTAEMEETSARIVLDYVEKRLKGG